MVSTPLPGRSLAKSFVLLRIGEYTMQLVRKWPKEIIVRVIADILMINLTFFTAFIARFLGLIVFGFMAENVRPNLDYSILFWDF